MLLIPTPTRSRPAGRAVPTVRPATAPADPAEAGDRTTRGGQHLAPDGGVALRSGPALFAPPAGRRTVLQTARGPVQLRPVSPLDVAAVDRFVRGLSPASSLRRFHSPVRALTATQLAGVVDVDHRTRETLVAVAPDRRGRDEVVALAQYIEAPVGSSSVEVAAVVADAWHRAGLGRAALDAVLGAARTAGYTTATAYVQGDNRPMLDLIRTAGRPMAVHRDGTAVELVIEIG